MVVRNILAMRRNSMDENGSSVDQEVAAIMQLGERLSNWSRWGPDDQLGTLNYISPAVVREAARAVRTGRVIPLGVPLTRDGPQKAHAFRFNPLHFMVKAHEEVLPGGASIADDVLVLGLQCATQWDSLAHVGHLGRMYGGRSVRGVTSAGAAENDIARISGQVATRGLLADVARLRNVASLAPGQVIERADLEECLNAAGVEPKEGDVLLVRTGFLERSRQDGWAGFSGAAPGLGLSVLDWLAEHRLAGVAADNSAIEVKPSSVAGVSLPFHVVALVYMGLLLGEIFDLAALAADCASDGIYEFFFVAPPLPITGAVGSPINPYAIK
jgi:kynurenine formamidase